MDEIHPIGGRKDENKIDIEKLLAHFGEKSEKSIAGTRFISARK